MGMFENFSQASLTRQFQTAFISSAFVLSLILMVITKYQLDWLHDILLQSSESCIQDSAFRQLRDLAEIKSNFMENEFTKYINFLIICWQIELDILGFTNQSLSTVNSYAHLASWNFEPNTFYFHGDFMSSLSPLSAAGSNLEKKFSSIDYYLCFMYNVEYNKIYTGFEIDEIYYFYPGGTSSDTTYTPLVSEWYYTAAENPGEIIITEPYQDPNMLNWTFTISQAIMNPHNNSLYGVAGVEVSLNVLIASIQEIKFLETGFGLLISDAGIIVTPPDSWTSALGTTSSLQIDDESITGISSSQWIQIQDQDDGARFDFTDGSGNNYIAVKESIPLAYVTNTTYYVILCANKNDMTGILDSISNNFTDTYNVIFWTVLGIMILMFAAISACVFFYGKDISIKLGRVEKVLARITRRSLFPKVTRGLNLGKLDVKNQGMESLVLALKSRFHRIEDLEDEFSRYSWGPSRPKDELIYEGWSECLYPFNEFAKNELPWKSDLLKLVTFAQSALISNRKSL